MFALQTYLRLEHYGRDYFVLFFLILCDCVFPFLPGNVQMSAILEGDKTNGKHGSVNTVGFVVSGFASFDFLL